MYSDVVLELDHNDFEDILDAIKDDEGFTRISHCRLTAWKRWSGVTRPCRRGAGQAVPAGPVEQLWGAIHAVFASWMNQRAIDYRRIHEIPDSLGTAVTIQAMVFGNMGTDCATGVAFTRNPINGATRFWRISGQCPG